MMNLGTQMDVRVTGYSTDKFRLMLGATLCLLFKIHKDTIAQLGKTEICFPSWQMTQGTNMPQLSPTALISPFPPHRFRGKVSVFSGGCPSRVDQAPLVPIQSGPSLPTKHTLATWRQGNLCGCKPGFPPPLTYRENFRVNPHGCSSPYFMHVTTLSEHDLDTNRGNG